MDINANVAEVSKFKVTNSEGIIGIFIAEWTPNPVDVKTIPIIEVINNPINIAAGIFLINNIKVIPIPIRAKSGAGEVKWDKPTIFVGWLIIIPAFFKPIKVRKNPTPEPIAKCNTSGIAFIIFILKPVTVIKKKIIADKNTAARAAFQLYPSVFITVIANKAFTPIPGATPRG